MSTWRLHYLRRRAARMAFRAHREQELRAWIPAPPEQIQGRAAPLARRRNTP
eukprot:COSAG01_NODE_29436_length_637_cov_2.202602_1_plen_51_part_10